MKRLLNGVVEQALIQNNAVSSFLGRLMEQKYVTNMLLESREKTTYAEVVKKQDRKRDDSVVALIYPNIETESINTKTDIDPTNLGLGIKRVRKINKGGILLQVANQADFDKLEVEMNTNEKLKENYTIRKGSKLRPRLIIYDVNPDLTHEEIVNGINSQNDLQEISNSKIEFKLKGRKGTNVIISAFSNLLKRGKINITWERYNVRGFLKPMQCNNCYMWLGTADKKSDVKIVLPRIMTQRCVMRI